MLTYCSLATETDPSTLASVVPCSTLNIPPHVWLIVFEHMIDCGEYGELWMNVQYVSKDFHHIMQRIFQNFVLRDAELDVDYRM